MAIKLKDGKVVLKDGKASCTCCEENPCKYQLVCINGVPVPINEQGGTPGCGCGGSTPYQLCVDDFLSCYFIVYSCDINGWFIYFLEDDGSGNPYPCTVMLISESPFGTYTDTSAGPCDVPARRAITVSQCV
jgi:hypothetical protein